MTYKRCIVPQCKSTSIANPKKVFVYVPKNVDTRIKWLKSAKIDPKGILSHANMFMCEDHFDMEKDTMNYMKYKMGFCKRLVLTYEALPKKFPWQEDCKSRLCVPEYSQDLIAKRRRLNLLQECKNKVCPPCVNTIVSILDKDIIMPPDIVKSKELPKTQDKGTMTDLKATVEKSTQLKFKSNKHYRSKAVQTKCNYKDSSTSPCKMSTESTQYHLKPVKVVKYIP